ncbi:hypothetical protein [Massilioclostridium coli]|uniref:hypothetical protein n=1 Tax=Massilioclostridium coli TaxID=1870991 RepID=UPI00114C9386|nr:hypothetical protein [Massilioclostridium coli]
MGMGLHCLKSVAAPIAFYDHSEKAPAIVFYSHLKKAFASAFDSHSFDWIRFSPKKSGSRRNNYRRLPLWYRNQNSSKIVLM